MAYPPPKVNRPIFAKDRNSLSLALAAFAFFMMCVSLVPHFPAVTKFYGFLTAIFRVAFFLFR